MYTIGLIGCGRISFKHVEGYLKNSDKLVMVAACDPRVERAQAKADEYTKGSPGALVKVYADYRAMLAELRPDIVTIATESGYHPRIAIDCLEAGCHVIDRKSVV